MEILRLKTTLSILAPQEKNEAPENLPILERNPTFQDVQVKPSRNLLIAENRTFR